MTATGQLPRIDEHSTVIEADAGRVWEALLRVAEGSTSGSMSPRYARLVGCEDTDPSGPRPLAPGSAFPGFHVEGADEGRELALAGSHRFSEYGLIFHIDDLGDGSTRLRAETRASFPGIKGQAYKTMVIRSRGHVVVVRRMLGAAKRRAERG